MTQGPATPSQWFPPTRSFTSGRWSLLVRDGELAEIAVDGQVLLRGVRAIVRVADWVTVPWSVTSVDMTDASVTVRLEATEPQITGTLRAEIDGDRLTATVELEPAEELWTNRAGLVVLHPPVLAGTPLVVRHPDGGRSPAEFPEAPAPHQPARDIAGLTWDQGGLRVELGLEGDVFEMEDQRNWTDASFKTYNRPLSLPFPYRIGACERIRHGLVVSASGATAQLPSGAAVAPGRGVSSQGTGGHGPHVIDLVAADPLPQIGLGAATAPDPAPEIGMDRGVPLLVELDLRTATWQAALERAVASGHPLDVRLVLEPADPADSADPANREKVRSAVAGLVGQRVLRVGAYAGGSPRHVSDAATIAVLREALDAAGLDLPVVGGARSHFTELNRGQHLLPADLDGLAVAMSPLFHDLGTPQLVESVAMQRILARRMVALAEEKARGAGVHIGPVTLRPPFNAVAERDYASPTRPDLAEGYGPALADATDPRQQAPELAAWTIASAAALAVPGVTSISYFEQWGPRGVVDSDGAPYPVAGALEALRGLVAPGDPAVTHGNRSADAAPSGAVQLLSGDSPDGLLWAVGSADGPQTTLLLANLHPVSREVRVNTPAGTVTECVEAASWVSRTMV
ncbi:hypothetical protein IM660_18425 [Ruania alkalisoli]|uniref:Uncharacterized protein n=1 Tax=Ruania alkalisoli TaxID=2779775 RepID=A0A7M1SU23_9MICO|nr:hypothetical protein [Ruania alkalisoli]QOR70537.1 hypothetical protein IM660_18425 [Ruania alkalisoli]